MILSNLIKINKSKLTKIFFVFLSLLIFVLPMVGYGQENNQEETEDSTEEERLRSFHNDNYEENPEKLINMQNNLRNSINKYTSVKIYSKLEQDKKPLNVTLHLEIDSILKEIRSREEDKKRIREDEESDLTDEEKDDLINLLEEQQKTLARNAERIILRHNASFLHVNESRDDNVKAQDLTLNDVSGLKVVDGNVSCGFLDGMCWLANMSYHVVLIPSATLTTWSARFFDYVVLETIVEMGDWLYPKNPDGTPKRDSVIDTGWTVIRDFVNIAFIFVLLYISIMTIIKGSGETGKKVFQVIAIAILINFSLFFTKVIIDVGNLMALSVYETAINASGDPNEVAICQEADQKSLSCPLLAKTGVGTVLGSGKTTTDLSNRVKGNITNLFVIKQSLFGAALLLVVAFVLFMAAFMLLTRFIIIVFVLITSAAAIAGYILPQLKSNVTNRWWSSLTGQVIFPIVFFILLYVSLVMLDNIGIDQKTTSGAIQYEKFEAVGSRGDAQALFGYVLVIMFVVGSLKIAKSVAGSSGDKLRSALGKTAGFAGGFGIGAAGTLGFISRRPLGWAASKGANRIEGKNAFTRSVKSGLTRASKSSFDIRNSKTFSKATDKMGIKTGKGRGSGGYAKIVEKGEKKTKERAEMIAKPTTKEINQNIKLEGILNERNSLREQESKLTKNDKEVSEQIVKLEKEQKTTSNIAKSSELKSQIEQLKQKKGTYSAGLADVESKMKQLEDKVKEDDDLELDGLDDLEKVIKSNLSAGKERRKQFVENVNNRPKIFKSAGASSFVRKEKMKALAENAKSPEEKKADSLANLVGDILDKKDDKKGTDDKKEEDK